MDHRSSTVQIKYSVEYKGRNMIRVQGSPLDFSSND